MVSRSFVHQVFLLSVVTSAPTVSHRKLGHHAEKDKIMGFCLINNAAIAARHAQKLGMEKVIILDWDGISRRDFVIAFSSLNVRFFWRYQVHHGNGTQNIFYDDPSVIYMSVHKVFRSSTFSLLTNKGGNYYPGTGRPFEVLEPFSFLNYSFWRLEQAKGKDLPLIAHSSLQVPRIIHVMCDNHHIGMNDSDYIAFFERVFVPIAKEFNPDLIIVSAGTFFWNFLFRFPNVIFLSQCKDLTVLVTISLVQWM